MIPETLDPLSVFIFGELGLDFLMSSVFKNFDASVFL